MIAQVFVAPSHHKIYYVNLRIVGIIGTKSADLQFHWLTKDEGIFLSSLVHTQSSTTERLHNSPKPFSINEYGWAVNFGH